MNEDRKTKNPFKNAIFKPNQIFASMPVELKPKDWKP